MKRVSKKRIFLFFFLNIFLFTASPSLRLEAQQVTISRIELMPNAPSPYLLRNWKNVALGFDSLAFDLNRPGQYLPVVWLNQSPVNYPGHPGLGMHTYIGTTTPTTSEAITILPAVIGGSLVGLDKSNQSGTNWVLMCEEYFNKRPAENVYLNRPVASSGEDWWYETMPNVFFYQLRSMYPGVGDFQNQFTTVADQWLQAVRSMGGSTTPWRIPSMNYRAWSLSTMEPKTDGVIEPEAAGAIAWILYQAFVETGDTKYRIGAEWSMEFLNGLSSNPSYELQLPYGAYIAARMNTELGTTYDIPKLLNWCFDVGPLRSWGAIVGNWGGYDCSGLIGEVNGTSDYAFAMNTFEQIGALVPLVRYDDRFARAIGKWVLNASNAARLFYTVYLPDQNQDSEVWAHQYDTSSLIAHEAIRQTLFSASPYATGDAISGGWAATNLALYASSHVGILGGIIDTTNVEKILRLDVLKTDYYHDTAYVSFLYYSPYDSARVVDVEVGPGTKDIYDAVSNSFLATNVAGLVPVTIPADGAALVVIVPAGGVITYELDKMLVNGVVVDYRSGQPVANYPPRIKSLSASPSLLLPGGASTLYCSAADRDGDALSFAWAAQQGAITGTSATITWTAPMQLGLYDISCVVTDGRGGEDSVIVHVEVVDVLPSSPVISRITAKPGKIDLGAVSTLTCLVTDTSGTPLSFSWSAGAGSLSAGDSSVIWTAPAMAGNYPVRCLVTNGAGGSAEDSVMVPVRDFSQTQSGNLIAFYPFSGNANDASGSQNDGTVSGATLTADRSGNPNSAYAFNGANSFIQVSNQTALNFQSAITVSFWMNVGAFYAREQYPLSHGNWENRWKVSITNNRIRWTVKTSTGIKDLDSGTLLQLNTFYHVVARYDGSDFEVYINGNLDAFSTFSGTILQTTIDFMIGQVLPGNSQYNFNGILDEIRIYDYGLSVPEIESLYQDATAVHGAPATAEPATFSLMQNFPNPFNSSTTIPFSVPAHSGSLGLTLWLYDLTGREIASMPLGNLFPGDYVYRLESGNLPSGVYYYSLRGVGVFLGRKMVLIK